MTILYHHYKNAAFELEIPREPNGRIAKIISSINFTHLITYNITDFRKYSIPV